MAVDSNTIANQALIIASDNMPAVVGQAPTFDNSTAGKALQSLYTPCVQTVAREFGWDFARASVNLTLTANSAPLGYAFEYLYPNGVQVWQLLPATITDPNNPTPVNYNVGNAQVSGVQTKVIWTSVPAAKAIYNNAPQESTWDPLFREAVVRLLASELSIALNGRPDTASVLLDSGSAFESIGEMRQD